MTAFLFIPAGLGGDSRRVDLGNIASLFAEREEPMRRPDARRHLVRVAVAALFVVVAIGDTLLVARPNVLTGPAPARPLHAHSTL